MAIPGNFLSPTTESIDPNTSGWTPKLNCAPLFKGVGGRNGDGCLVTKSVAAGEVQARTVSSYPVTAGTVYYTCLLYTSPSPRDLSTSRMPSSA